MRTIPLTKGYVTIVDDEDYERLAQHKWNAFVRVINGREYVLARRAGSGNRTLLMHREIMSAPSGVEVDHRDGDGLNNRRQNLRLCTRRHNMANTPNKRLSRSGYRGVKKNANGDKWTATVKCYGRSIGLGSSYVTPEAAAAAYNAAAIIHFGEFAVLNDLGDGSHG